MAVDPPVDRPFRGSPVFTWVLWVLTHPESLFCLVSSSSSSHSGAATGSVSDQAMRKLTSSFKRS